MSGSRWVISEIICGLLFQPVYIYYIFKNIAEEKEEEKTKKKVNDQKANLLAGSLRASLLDKIKKKKG